MAIESVMHLLYGGGSLSTSDYNFGKNSFVFHLKVFISTKSEEKVVADFEKLFNATLLTLLYILPDINF